MQLLYIGKSADAENRIKRHGCWIKWEYDAIRVRLASVVEFNGWAEFEKIEAYNTMCKGDLPDTGLRIFNTGKLGHLLPEVSSLYYAV